LLQLVDQQHCGIAIGRRVARGHGHRKPLVGPVAELLHSLARFGPVLGNVRAVSRECLQGLGRHPPTASRRRHHGAPGPARPDAENIYNGATIEVSAIARRSSGLSNGGLPRFTSSCLGMFQDTTLHSEFGACSLICFINGIDIYPWPVRSSLPAAKAR